MSSYDFIVDNMRFSHSSTSSFENCAHGFKLAYITPMPREDNFFSDYGLLVHDCMERFFNKELEGYELSGHYLKMFDSAVKCPAPDQAMRGRYKEQGLYFFDNFSFPLEEYEVVVVEDTIDFNLYGIEITARPDLVLRKKRDGKTVLVDYKTSLPFRKNMKTGEKTTPDKKKLEGYYKQMYLYAYALREHKGMHIDEICLWFPRANRMITIPWSLEKEEEAIKQFKSIVVRIREEEVFPADNSSSYFCENLCGVRKYCEYR